MNDYSRKVIKSFFFNGIYYSKNFILVLLITKYASMADLGIYQSVIALTGFVIQIASLSLDESFVRFARDKKELTINAKFFNTLATLIISLCIFAVAYYYGANVINNYLFKNDSYTLVILKYSSILIITEPLFLFIMSYWRCSFDDLKYNFYLMTYTILYIGNIFLILSLQQHLKYIFLSQGLLTLALCFLQLIQIPGEKKFSISFIFVKELIYYALPLIPIPLLIWVIQSSDLYFINLYDNFATSGLYSFAYTLSLIIMMIYSPFYIYFIPKISQLFEENSPNLHKLFQTTVTLPIIICTPIILCFFSFENQLFDLFIKDYRPLEVPITPIISFAIMTGYTGQLYATSAKLKKNTKIILISHLIAAIINIIGNILLIQAYSVLGAALSTLITYLALALFLILSSRKYIKFEINHRFYYFILIFTTLYGTIFTILKTIYQQNNIVLGTVYLLICLILFPIMINKLNFFKLSDIR